MLDRSPTMPLLPVLAGAARDGSPMIGYIPAAGSSPIGAEIGISPGAGSALADSGDSPGSVSDAAGVDSAGFVRPGLASAGSVNAGPVAVSPGRVALGAVRPGVVRPGVDSPGAVKPGVDSPGAVRAGEVNPCVVSAGGVVEPVPVSTPVGIGGRLMPN